MNAIQLIAFFAFIGLGILLVVLLRKSRKKKGPLVTGEDMLDTFTKHLDNL